MKQLLTVTGADALEFLQGQLTQDVAEVSDTDSRLSAWCNPKGRVIATMRLLCIDGGMGLVTSANIADTVASRLALFKFRARVDIQIAAAHWSAAAVQAPGDIERLQELELLPPAGTAMRSRGLHLLRADAVTDCVEIFGDPAAVAGLGLDPDDALSDEQWHAATIRGGVPTIDARNSEQFTPHMLNLDRSGAVNFDKGCYTGQEIVARTQNRGRSRRRLALFEAARPGVAVGDKLQLADAVVGEVVDSAGVDLLALLPCELHDTSMQAGDVAVSPAPLPYSL